MGWTFYNRSVADPFAELRGLVTFTDGETVNRMVTDAMVGSTYYAAAETVKKDGSRTVWAAVILVQMGGGFGYKGMDETMGPNERNAPLHVLEALTPLHPAYADGFAAQWRWDCWRNLARTDAKALTRFSTMGARPLTKAEKWEAEHYADHVTRTCWGSWADWVKEGHVGICARRVCDGDERYLVVPSDLHDAQPRGPAIGYAVPLSWFDAYLSDGPDNGATTKRVA